jgi:hypothetical protein
MVRDSNIYEYFLDSIRRKLLSLLHANETNFNLSLIQWRNAPLNSYGPHQPRPIAQKIRKRKKCRLR